MKKIAITIGVFDCLHEGHVDLLTRMREAAEKVVVILHNDLSTFKNKGRFPIQEKSVRHRNLLASGLVDEVHEVTDPNPTDAYNAVLRDLKERGLYHPHMDAVYMRGDDWEDFPGRQAVAESGVEIRLKEYFPGVSTTAIRKEATSSDHQKYITLPCLECKKPQSVPEGSAVGQGVFNCFCSGECEDKYAAKQ